MAVGAGLGAISGAANILGTAGAQIGLNEVNDFAKMQVQASNKASALIPPN